jgi:tetratricopeptide (TPR) repeat protein
MSERGKENDDISFEIRFYEDLLNKHGNFEQALMALGDLYTKTGRYEDGLAIDQRLLRLRPDDPYVIYNLACSYALLNRVEEAHKMIKLAIDSGYEDFAYLERDADLASLMGDKTFMAYFSEQKRRHKSQNGRPDG